MEEVLFAREGQLGLITLNRPTALNALNLPMIKVIQQQLELWAQDDAVKAVVLRSSASKAFCAGGDVRWLYQAGLEKNPEQMQFFWHEYRLNHYISQFKKPYIALMDGVTMGGGVGISLHGSYPVASENFVFAMPETSIGFFPDIGASHLLTRCPGAWGVYLGLTGNRIGAQDAKNCTLVKAVVASAKMNEFVKKLSSVDLTQDAFKQVDACVYEYSNLETDHEVSPLDVLLETCFVLPDIKQIMNALSVSKHPLAVEVARTLEKKSPLSLNVTLTQLQKTKGLSLADCLKMDYDLVSHFMQGSDFYEGVRALLVDKDKNPLWNPPNLDRVTEHQVVNYFERVFPALELIDC